MANLSALESSVKAIQAIYSNLENGTASQEEIDQLVDHTKELYERAIILRYKAYETKILGVRETNQEVVVENPVSEEEIPCQDSHEITDYEIDKIDLENELVEEENKTEQPSFDFSLFENSTNEVKTEEPEVSEEQTIENVTATFTHAEEINLQEEEPEVEQNLIIPATIENNGFIAQYATIEPSFFSQIGMSKLDTLIGSFGLNERLQYINELFDGSSEAFADAIKSIDSMSSYQDVLAKTSTFANQYNWDLKSETVEEFITKLKRRHG